MCFISLIHIDTMMNIKNFISGLALTRHVDGRCRHRDCAAER